MRNLLIISSEPLNPKNLIGSIFELAQAKILQEKYKVTVLAIREEASLIVQFKEFIKYAVVTADFKSAVKKLKGLLLLLSYFLRLRRQTSYYKIDGVDVIECMNYSVSVPTGFSARLNKWISSGKKGFNHYRKRNGLPFLIHAHGRFLNAGWLAFVINSEFKVPFVYTDHSTFYQSGIAPIEAKPFLRKVMEGASAFIVVSPSLLSHIEGFLQQKIPYAKVIPNVVHKIFERPATHLASEVFEFITVASLEYRKGLDVLLRAFSSVFINTSNVRLRIIGGGALLHELEALARSLQISTKVIFEGVKPQEVIVDLLDNAQTFVLPSRNETFGVVVIEALARGLPAVVTECGGPEYIVDNDNGIIVGKDDERALAEAMNKIYLNQNSYNRIKISEQAIRKFGSSAFLETMEMIYNSSAKSVKN